MIDSDSRESALALRASGTRCTGRRPGRSRGGGQTAFALGTLASKLAGAAHGLGLLARLLLGRLLVVVAELHLAEDAFALKLLFQGPERLIHIVIANNYLQAASPFVNRQICLSEAQSPQTGS